MKKAEFNPPGAADCTLRAACSCVPGQTRTRREAVGQGRKSKIRFLPLGTYMPKNPPAASLPDLPASYEAALSELEQLVTRLESGQMPLDELLAGYQRGAALLAFCKDKLQAVEDQIKVLDGGQLKPWDAA